MLFLFFFVTLAMIINEIIVVEVTYIGIVIYGFFNIIKFIYAFSETTRTYFNLEVIRTFVFANKFAWEEILSIFFKFFLFLELFQFDVFCFRVFFWEYLIFMEVHFSAYF
jgi:hypothetical protein